MSATEGGIERSEQRQTSARGETRTWKPAASAAKIALPPAPVVLGNVCDNLPLLERELVILGCVVLKCHLGGNWREAERQKQKGKGKGSEESAENPMRGCCWKVNAPLLPSSPLSDSPILCAPCARRPLAIVGESGQVSVSGSV